MFKWIYDGVLKPILAVFLLLISITGTAAEWSTYVVGGEDAQREYPWVAALYNSGDFSCGATLISANWLVTAAHCVYDSDSEAAYSASNFNVIIGDSTYYYSTSYARRLGASVADIESVIIHPSYNNDDTDYDIALLELSTPYYQSGPALATADDFDSIDSGDYLTVLGYGLMSTDEDATYDEAYPSTLQEADLPYVQTEECYWQSGMTDNMFCAGYESTAINIDSCYGDSGGPLVASLNGQLTLVGIVSFGDEYCEDHPGGYTNVSNLRTWLLNNIDGVQVVEEGTASYDEDDDTFQSGLISIYHYGSVTDDPIEIGSLSFDDSIYDQTFTLSDNCSGSTLYASDASCQFDFDLQAIPSADQVFSAQLTVDGESYDLRFNEEYLNEGESSYSGDNSISFNSFNSGSSGSLGVIGLLSLILCQIMRRKTLIKSLC